MVGGCYFLILDGFLDFFLILGGWPTFSFFCSKPEPAEPEPVAVGTVPNRTVGFLRFGSEPFDLLSDTITFGSPGGGKEIEVLVEPFKKMNGKDNISNFLSPARCFPEIQTMVFRNGPKNMKFGTLKCPESGQISSYRGLRGTIRRRKMRSFF